MKDGGPFSDVWLLYLNSDCQTLKEKKLKQRFATENWKCLITVATRHVPEIWNQPKTESLIFNYKPVVGLLATHELWGA